MHIQPSSRWIMITVVACLVLFVAAGSASLGGVLPHDLKIEKVLDHSAELGDLAQSPTGELWLLERSGTVRVLSGGHEVANLGIAVSTACDAGLLGIEFAPDHATTGMAFVYYVDGTGNARVDEIVRNPSGLTLGARLIDIGPTGAGCRPGGALAIGADDKLYVAVGDLGNGSDAQNDASLAGKVLRTELDGGIPADNPSGTLVWAKGFRDGASLAVNPSTSHPQGTLYLADRGDGTTSASDEINAVVGGGNHGWPNATGPHGGYDDPVTSGDQWGVSAVETRSGDGSVLYACVQAGDIQLATVSGPGMDVLESNATFYDPLADRNGTPDPGCPHEFNTVLEGGDGNVYGTNLGANPGLWRIWQDLPGPREVSAPGSPLQLDIDKSGTDLDIAWEALGDLDIGRPSRHGGQHAADYQVWEGTLPIGGSYDHAAVLATDGTPDGQARRSATIAPGAGSRYYLVTAQGDNTEGPFGDGRPAAHDYCDDKGRGNAVGNCVMRWTNPVDGKELYLTDYNPDSPTYLQKLTMNDFRGRAMHLDISADDCFWCGIQAPFIGEVQTELGDQDFAAVTVFTKNYGNLTPYPPGDCAAAILAWSQDHGDGPVLCDTDHDSNGRGDVSDQMFVGGAACGGTPQNFYIDQGHVIYDFICGGQLSSAGIRNNVINEVNPNTCE